jgi:hypothetical protein
MLHPIVKSYIKNSFLKSKFKYLLVLLSHQPSVQMFVLFRLHNSEKNKTKKSSRKLLSAACSKERSTFHLYRQVAH